jgi:metal-responsive CopG/Arc/MetJ family transcriptional regulator
LKYLTVLIERFGGNPQSIKTPQDAIDELIQLVSDREENAREEAIRELQQEYFNDSTGDIQEAINKFRDTTIQNFDSQLREEMITLKKKHQSEISELNNSHQKSIIELEK